MQSIHIFLIIALIVGIALWIFEDHVCGKVHNSQDDFNEAEGEEWLNDHEGWM